MTPEATVFNSWGSSLKMYFSPAGSALLRTDLVDSAFEWITDETWWENINTTNKADPKWIIMKQ